MKTLTRLVLCAALPVAALPALSAVSGAASPDPQDAPSMSARADAVSWGETRRDVLSGAARSYSYTATEAAVARFVLGDLPANYNLALADSSGKVLKQSRKGGRQFEQIVARVTPGKYTLTVTAKDTASTSPFTLVGDVYTKPTVLSKTLTTDADENRAQYVVEFINPTKSLIGFEGTVEVYDAQGGFLSEQPLEYYWLPVGASTGLSATDDYYDLWMEKGATLKLVDAKFVDYSRCATKKPPRLSKVTWSELDDTQVGSPRWYASGLATNRSAVSQMIDGVWAKRDRMGVPYQVGSFTLERVEPGRKSSFEATLFEDTNYDEVPAFTLFPYYRYSCD